MNDLKQVMTIIKALGKEKEQRLMEISRINQTILKKTDLVNKMVMYVKDYGSKQNLMVSKGVPSLSVNLYLFSGQIEKVIAKTEEEIEKLKVWRENISKKMEEVKKKIDLMEEFEKKIRLNKRIVLEKREQRMLEEISLSKHLWGDHD